MQNPYSQYLKNQKNSPQRKPQKKAIGSRQPNVKSQSKSLDRRASSLSLPWIFGSLAGLVCSFYIFTYTDQVLQVFSRIRIGVSSSLASEEAKSSSETGKDDTQKNQLPVGEISQLTSSDDDLTMKNANIYKALKDKRQELEKKERRLAQLEEELQKQKAEIERQLKEMQELRNNISQKLDRKVAADQQSITKLVGVYSSMKPKNAAMILSQIDDELAVKVLGQMKKQNAAAILNFVEPKKAQYLSEKFTGLKQ
jgi:flagellar motility protein MotE (MotC chaperone)